MRLYIIFSFSALRSCLRTALNKLPATLEKMSIESGCKTKPRIAIIGAGVTGLTVGKALAETYGNQLELTLIAEKFSPDTTSDRAGGIFNPEVSNSHYTHTEDKEGFERDVHSWAPATFHYFNHLCNSPLRNESGVFRSPMYKFYKKTYQPPSWLRDELYPDYRILSKGEAKDMGLPYQGFESIVTFTTVTVRGTVYLPWLMRVFQERGGLIVKQKIKSFNELSSFDVIINCTGLGARELAGDRFMRPVRGQLVVVKATDPPKVNAIYYNKEFDHSSFVHVIPFKDTILLGKRFMFCAIRILLKFCLNLEEFFLPNIKNLTAYIFNCRWYTRGRRVVYSP